ncbi:MAG: glycosyltransferase family 2 protein [Proteobacteria bacterium]|nr:glycosyltransferase family 2 protein [Pseudomonadota bacterium]MCP4917421.1 glycosyltransferase family 2 protein [Pseudomonadota bacterium]
MDLAGLSTQDLRQLGEALRQNETVRLRLTDDFPKHLRANQIVPLVDVVETRTGAFTEALSAHLPIPGREDAPELRVTALIPTHRRTPIGLRALREQDCDVEVVVLANGEAMSRGVQGDRVMAVDWRGHGATRQAGLSFADRDYVLFTVDDALPRGRGCVRALVEALEEGGYDAVFGRQVPWPDADPITRLRLHDWTPPGHGHWPVERLDHVFALYRRSTLQEHPLPAVPIGEDLHWRQGRRIGYVPGAMVVHSHERRPRELYRRTRDLHVQHHLVGDSPLVPSLSSVFAALPGLVRPVLRAGLGEAPNHLAELLGQWRAARITRP